MQLNASIIYGFTRSVLAARFDNPKPIPEFHKELWELCCDPHDKVAIAAPRGHAKSTAITHSFTLASVLFGFRQHVLIVSDTEGQACDFLGDIAMELKENEIIEQLFGPIHFVKDSAKEIVVRATIDGKPNLFRIIAKGSEQKLRGLKWRHKRPDLVIGDDLENDEIVLNQERRKKFKKWFLGALLPLVSDTAIVRVVGTILHLDSLLEGLMPENQIPKTEPDKKVWLRHTELKEWTTHPDVVWKSVRYKAHNEDFSKILWPTQFPEKRLRSIRQGFLNDGFPEGYAQEYLNYPIDESLAYFRREDILPIEDADRDTPRSAVYVGVDFAISQENYADYTAMVVVELTAKGKLHVIDVRRGRWDTYGILDEIFSLHERYTPNLFLFEKGAIEKALEPVLLEEMEYRDLYPAYTTVSPSKDKMLRARALQARTRAGAVLFDTETTWYQDFELEMRTFPRGKHDDQVDALAYICLQLQNLVKSPTYEEQADDLYEEEYNDAMSSYGRNVYTGY